MFPLAWFSKKFAVIYAKSIFAFAFLATTSIFAIDPSAVNLSTGISYTDLQNAINAAHSGDIIQVNGTFTGNFAITKSLTLRGGKHGVLDGNQTGSALYVGNSPEYVVELSDLEIRNGNNAHGGGIANAATLTLNNVNIVQNTASEKGGGVFNDSQSSLTIIDSVISRNSAAHGGGIASVQGALLISSSEISFNQSTGNGSGVYMDSSLNRVEIQNSKLFDNTSDSGLGGALYSINNQLNLTDLKINNNKAVSGGAIYNDQDSILNVSSSTLQYNVASLSGGGLYNHRGSASFNSCKVTHNEASVTGGGILNVVGSFLRIGYSKIDKNTPDNISNLN